VVARPHPGQLFCSNTGEECQCHNRVRCVEDRVGCSLPGGQDKGKVDSNGSRAAHQCTGDECSKAGNAMLPQGNSQCCCAAKDGQQGSKIPVKQDGWTHLVSLVSDGLTSLGVVPIAEDAKHLPGKENVLADWESRHTCDSSDWKLLPLVPSPWIYLPAKPTTSSQCTPAGSRIH